MTTIPHGAVRGQLCILEVRRSSTYLKSDTVESLHFEAAIVTGVSRDAIVKRVRRGGYEEKIARMFGFRYAHLVPTARLAREHVPFAMSCFSQDGWDTIEAARDAVLAAIAASDIIHAPIDPENPLTPDNLPQRAQEAVDRAISSAA